jgi:hypothetical protein
VDGKSPYVLYGATGAPWLAFSFWNLNSFPGLWLDLQRGTWFRLHPIGEGEPMTNVWMHICADVDTVTGNISVSLNGRPSLTVASEKLRTKMPEYLPNALKLGLKETEEISGGKRQFLGFVTNINVFHYNETLSIEDLSKTLCESAGDYLAWADAEFQLEGASVRETEVEPGSVCGDTPETYRVLLLEELRWADGELGCRTLAGGQMARIRGEEELQWTGAAMARGACRGVWSPTSDRAEEGVYRNTLTGEEETFLPWREGQPNGTDTDTLNY